MPPLVYATAAAVRRAAQLCPGLVLENAVASAIVRGDLVGGHKGGVVFLDDRAVVARVERKPGRLRERPRQWLVTDLEPHREVRRNGNR